MGMVCVYSWSDMGVIIGLVLDNFFNSLLSGIQVYELWIVIWGIFDILIFFLFFIEIFDGVMFEWWDFIKGEYEEVMEEDDILFLGLERSDMDRYGFVIFGSLLGVLVFLFICMVICCWKRIIRYI